MRKAIYLMILFVFAAYSFKASAEIRSNEQNSKPTYEVSDLTKNPFGDYESIFGTKDLLPETQMQYNATIFVLRSSMYSHLGRVSPIAYDPVSESYFVVGMSREFDQQTSQLTHAPVKLGWSEDGMSWDTTTVFGIEGFGGFYPSVAVANYSDASDAEEVPYLVYSRALIQSGSEWNFNGGLIITGTASQDEPYIETFDAPENNNPSDAQLWGNMKLKDFVMEGEGYCFGAGILSPVSEGYQYGSYGFWGYYLNDQQQVASTIPQYWTDANFIPSDQPASSYQTAMEFDIDANGKLYAAVHNIFIDDQENRVPGVSTSDDLGNTWSDFNKMPVSFFANYADAAGYDNYMTYGTYNMYAFVTYGEDEFSYFLRLGLYNEGDEQLQEIHIVEVYYKNDSWGVRGVAGLQGSPMILTYSGKFSTQQQIVHQLQGNPLGNELQAVKTADGESILLKWVDVSMTLETEESIPYSYIDRNTNEEVLADDELDGTHTTDMFITYRDIDDTEWMSPGNVTEDSLFDKATWLPNVIKSLKSVTFINSLTPTGITDSDHPYYQMPRPFLRQIADFYPNIVVSSFDATEIVGVEEQHKANYNFELMDAVPNPAQSFADISFNLEKAGRVKLAVYNSMGQLVETLVDSYQNPGIHAVSLNLSEYSSGTYYYSLIVDGKRFTKSLNVVK